MTVDVAVKKMPLSFTRFPRILLALRPQENLKLNSQVARTEEIIPAGNELTAFFK